MAKNYPDELAEWVRKTPATKRDRNLATFIAVRHDVLTALDTGYPIKTIWRNLTDSGRIDFSYDAFRRYVQRFRATGNAKPADLPAAPPEPPGKACDAGKVPPQVKPVQPAGFVFNPVPRKEELL